jgi:hypothetical protein
MLVQPVKIGERIQSGPACVWFLNTLWLAYGAMNGRLVLLSVNVREDGNTQRHASMFSAGNFTSAAVWNGRLYVLFGVGGESYQLTSTANGSTFTSPRPVPIVNGFTGVGGLCAYAGGLAVLWAENAGGQAHMLRSGDGGATFTDVVLPFNAQPLPGITAGTDPTELIIAYGLRHGSPGNFTLAAIDAANPLHTLRSTNIPANIRPGGISLCPTRYHNRDGLHLAIQQWSSTGIIDYHARSAPQDLSMVGEEEAFLYLAEDLSLAFDGTHVWAAWRTMNNELWVGPYVNSFDLPANLSKLLGEECDEKGCPIDPRLVCAATDELRWDWESPAIHNALRGDLVLTPGDGRGVVGTLLEQLEPRQYYNHMGIMVGDYNLVRHATMAQPRLVKAEPGRFMTGEFFGVRAPADGFQWDAVKYGWPGTITQSVEDAFYTGFNTINPDTGRPYNPQGDYFALNPDKPPLPYPGPDAEKEALLKWECQQRFADPEFPQDEPYGITNLPSKPAYRLDTGELIHPIVVKPPLAFNGDPLVRAILHRVADEAERIDGHYRLYAYTDAAIALDPDMFGPAATDAIWQGRAPGAAWCAGTRPVVCSSFIWTAVQLANKKLPRIILEGDITESPDELLATPTVDGLYRYLTDERRKAGKALHVFLSERVRRDVYLGLQKFEHENRLEIDLAQIGLAALVTLLAGPAAAAAALLGVNLTTIAKLKLLLEDMPDDVATQMCNAFASDRPDETDDNLWESTGEGLAVSPDDVKKFWDAPDLNDRREIWHGLYGYCQKMMLTPGRYGLRRLHRWAHSEGPAFVHGMVTYNGEPVEGARVRFGCETVTTVRHADEQPRYQLDLSAGRYEAVATAYWPSTMEMLTGRRVVAVEPGDQAGSIDIELEDPPEWRRHIRCTGRISVVRRVVIGSDDWAHTAINLEGHLVKFPGMFGEPPSGAHHESWIGHVVSEFAQRFNVRVDIKVELQNDISISVTVRSVLCAHYYDGSRPPEGDEIVTTGQRGPVIVSPGDSVSFTIDHNSGNFPPDRGHVEVKIENMRSPA